MSLLSRPICAGAQVPIRARSVAAGLESRSEYSTYAGRANGRTLDIDFAHALGVMSDKHGISESFRLAFVVEHRVVVIVAGELDVVE